MTVRSAPLGTTTQVAALGTASVFTVPAGQSWIVKRVTSFLEGAPAATIIWRVENPTDLLCPLYRPTVSSNGVDDHETWWVLDEGDTLVVQNQSATASMRCRAFGAKLIGIAP